MGWQKIGSGSGRAISKQETKSCPLCGALNYHLNRECFTCGWHGQFTRDAAEIDYRWQNLIDRYEEVRLEHLVGHGRGMRVVDDFGVVRRTNPWQRWAGVCARHWQEFLARRNARCAEREAALRPKSSLPPQ